MSVWYQVSFVFVFVCCFENTTFPCCFFLPQTMSGWYQVSFVKKPQHASLRFKYTFSVVKETWTIKEVTVWKRKTAAKLCSSSGWRVLKEGKFEVIRCAWFELLTLSQKLEPTNFLPLCCKSEIFSSMDKSETDEYWSLLSCFVSQKSKDLHLLKKLEPRYMQIIKTISSSIQEITHIMEVVDF